MPDERLPAHFWPMVVGLGSGFIGIALAIGRLGNLAPYPLVAGGILLLVAAVMGMIRDR